MPSQPVVKDSMAQPGPHYSLDSKLFFDPQPTVVSPQVLQMNLLQQMASIQQQVNRMSTIFIASAVREGNLKGRSLIGVCLYSDSRVGESREGR